MSDAVTGEILRVYCNSSGGTIQVNSADWKYVSGNVTCSSEYYDFSLATEQFGSIYYAGISIGAWNTTVIEIQLVKQSDSVPKSVSE